MGGLKDGERAGGDGGGDKGLKDKSEWLIIKWSINWPSDWLIDHCQGNNFGDGGGGGGASKKDDFALNHVKHVVANTTPKVFTYSSTPCITMGTKLHKWFYSLLRHFSPVRGNFDWQWEVTLKIDTKITLTQTVNLELAHPSAGQFPR